MTDTDDSQMHAVYMVGEIVQERDRLWRELDELRSAAREVVDEFCDEFFSPTRAMKRLRSLAGVEDTNTKDATT